jgi:2-polyprenyl-6-methoxyphenol hydroxylase-like FAD-dependent oxidoreductase
VRELVVEGGRVIGIRGLENGSAPVEERSKVVIGADGVNSLVARNVRAQTYYDTGSLTCAHYAYFGGIRDQDDQAALYVLDEERRFIITFPTNDGLDVVFVFWPNEEARQVQANVDGAFHKVLDLVPDLAARVRSGQRESNYRGTNALPNFFREAHGPGWALIGDAALHRDPITAQGITNAFNHAHLLAEELGAAFNGDKPLHLALSNYDHRQFEQLKPMFDYTVQYAQLQPLASAARAMLAALAHDQNATNAFIGAFIGSVQLKDIFPAEIIEGFSQTVRRLAAGREQASHVA